ncbi:MAG: hypothetical protein EBU32_02540 [Opitutaceae bacterium]|nr:hypothetical protein [Opitutaceae bacterium]
MSNPNPSPSAAPRWFAWLAVVALLVYGIFLGAYFTPVAGGSDSSGYLNAAQLLARGQLTAPMRDYSGLTASSASQFQPLGFIAEPARQRLVPTYPLGLPSHLAIASTLFGWTIGPLVVGVGSTLAAIILMYAIARELAISWPLAAAGALMLGVFPVTIFIAIQPLSDVLATNWVLAAIYSALRAHSSQRWAVITGVALSIAIFVRPTNVLIFPAIAVLLSIGWRQLTAAALGGLPGGLLLLAANAHLFGSPWRMGYGSIFEAFDFTYLGPTLLHFGKWLGLLMPGLGLFFGVITISLTHATLRTRIALSFWFFTPVIFYAYYEVSSQTWWCLRFILPAVPALILSALFTLDYFLTLHPRALQITSALLAFWAIGLSVFWTREFHTLFSKTYEQAYAEMGRWSNDHLPENTVLLTNNDSGALYYYTPFPILRWDQMSSAEFTQHAAYLTRAGRPLHLITNEAEENHVLTQRVPARWEKITTLVQRSVWRYNGPATTP